MRRLSGLEDLRITSKLFADDVDLLTSSEHDLQQALGWFVGEFEAGMSVSISSHCTEPLW